jgi:pimeloyl-ACP methyl ester carboxylesterase
MLRSAVALAALATFTIALVLPLERRLARAEGAPFFPPPTRLTHEAVSGVAVERVRLDKESAEVDWSELARPKKTGQLYEVHFSAAGEWVQIPHCNGRERVLVDGAVKDPGSKGTLVLPLGPLREDAPHEVTIEIKASTYEKRLACSGPPRVGRAVPSTDGLARFRFGSPAPLAKGGGEAVVFVPGGHDRSRPAALLVGTHPWNGGPWTYAAYSELLEEAGRRDVVLLFPSGLGNSLYVAEAEDEVLRAIDALSAELAVDRQRVSIWGASMGGAGATTIAFHHPDRFAFVASYFGDSRYDLTSYVRKILGGEEGAHKVNALDMLENARWLPVFLIHGEEDRTSPLRQSTMLYDAMKKAGFQVDFAREPGMGHEGPLVIKHIRRVVERAALATAPARPLRVSFRSVRETDTEAYGVHLVRESAERDAFVDLERQNDGIHVLAAEGVSEVVLANDALGGAPAPILGTRGRVRWEK